jgi:hypothetical protein
LGGFCFDSMCVWCVWQLAVKVPRRAAEDLNERLWGVRPGMDDVRIWAGYK